MGQSLTFTWDGQLRLVAVTDALGQVSTIDYTDGANPLRITSITDPFDREATLTYNAAGQLESATDVLGLTSRFGYGPEDFVSSVTEGTFMRQGGAAVTFEPTIDAAAGRIELVLLRPGGQPTTTGSGLVASITFTAGQPGSTDMVITATATSASGPALPVESAPARVVVRE